MPNKPIKDQAAVLVDSPSPFEARIVLEPDHRDSRAVLYEGNMETAERLMSCWNVQLSVEIKAIRRYQPWDGRTERRAQDESMDRLKKALQRMLAMHDRMMGRIDHGASFYDADTIREMNEAPIEARKALREDI